MRREPNDTPLSEASVSDIADEIGRRVGLAPGRAFVLAYAEQTHDPDGGFCTDYVFRWANPLHALGLAARVELLMQENLDNIMSEERLDAELEHLEQNPEEDFDPPDDGFCGSA